MLISRNFILTLLTALLLIYTLPGYSQAEKKFIRQGNREYEKSNYSESEVSYRRAIDKNSELPDAVFNAGDALYRQDKFEDAGKEFAETHEISDDGKMKAASLYNLGNSLLNSKKIKESIDAYKRSLRLDPGNMEAKYNLAYAQDLLKQEQQKQQKQNRQDKQNQDQKDQKDQKDEQDNSNKDQTSKQQQQQKEQQQQEISKEDAERVLNALANDEKDIQEKVKLAKALKEKTRTTKNW
jgi:Ca-activated chloride channel family protein